jgi:hypothetical protein
MRTSNIFWLSLGALLHPCLPIQAAPPNVNYFFPAGAQRGTKVEITASGTFDRWPVQAWVDAKGIVIQPAKETGKLTITVAAEAEPGTCWIRLFDKEGASIARPFLIGTLPEVLEKEINDDPKKPQVLDQTALIVNGRLEKPGDVDVFALKLLQGQTLVASLEAFRTLRSPMDGILQVLSAEGFVLEQNNDYHNIDPQSIFPVPKDGIYLVRLFAFPAVPDSAIRLAGKEDYIYRLTLTTGGFVEYPFPMAVSRKAPGSIELVGWNFPDDLKKFPVAVGPTSNLVKMFHPQLANPFFVRLEPHPTITATGVSQQKPQPITLPITITGRLNQPGETNKFEFEGKKGEKIPFRIEARSVGFPLEPVLRVKDIAGKLLTQAQAKALNTDPTLDFTVLETGRYLLEVADLHGEGGLRYVYQLQVGQGEQDFDLKITGERFGLTPGKPLDIPISVERRGGFKQEVTLGVEGLPPGVTFETPGPSAVGKPPVLRLNAGEETYFSGPIRILGKTKDNMVRFARTPVAEFGVMTENFWLTVPGVAPTVPKKKKK